MGLDITAFSKLKHIGVHYDGPWCEEQYNDETLDRIHVAAFAYDCFPESFRGIPILGTKTGISSGSTFIEGGCFAVTPETESFGFRAGSYSGYSAWRSDLAQQFNPAPIVDLRTGMQKPDPDLPFFELIWFADNEGTIGPEAAADLLADFREHADRYEPGQHVEYFREKYADWTRAFELAADGGLVEFH